jgi:hypothetical protein
MAIPGQDGAEYNAYAVSSSATPIQRLLITERTTGDNYKHGMMATAYQGTLRNLPAISEAHGLTELERFFEPGARLYTVGNVSGVLVADPNKFYSTAHRDGLVAWFPFNEHPDDDLTAKDRSPVAGDLLPIMAFPSRRLWDDTRGWYLSPFNTTVYYNTSERPVTDTFALSFWFMPGGTGGNVFKFGLLRLDYENVGDELKVYYDNQFIGSLFPTFGDNFLFNFSFITISVSPTEIVMGLGDRTNPIVRWHFPGTYAEMTDTNLSLTGQQVGWSDLRIWNVLKTEDELNTILDYAPDRHAGGLPDRHDQECKHSRPLRPAGARKRPVRRGSAPGVVHRTSPPSSRATTAWAATAARADSKRLASAAARLHPRQLQARRAVPEHDRRRGRRGLDGLRRAALVRTSSGSTRAARPIT